VLYNEYHEQYALADAVGFDGIMTNEHHAAYWCMKPCVNLDAAVAQFISICRWLRLVYKDQLVLLENAPFSTL
jgi:hypothetical protein